MKILIDDGMQIQIGTGIGKYSWHLYQSLKKCTDINVDLAEFDKRELSKISGRLAYLKYINSDEYLKMSEQYDVIHYTNYAMPFRKNNKSKYIVTIHDLVSFLYPETLPFSYRYYSKLTILHSLYSADVIFTDSYSVRKEIINKWPQYEIKVFVGYPGFYTEFKQLNLSNVKYENQKIFSVENKKFFLFVGTIEKRKNVGILIEAFLNLRKNRMLNNYKLVLAGRAGYGFEHFQSIVKDAKAQNEIIFTGYISDNDCAKLYREAAAYIFPSVYEGFGSTQLECMANKLPLICSNIPTNKEISGEYGMFFELKDVNSLICQMKNVIEKNYNEIEMQKTGFNILNRFQWETLINQYIEKYQYTIDKVKL